MKQKVAEKKCDELFNREKSMISKMIWREKHIAGKESRAVDDTVADLANDAIDDEDSGNNKEILTDMDVNTVFVLPAEFRAPEA